MFAVASRTAAPAATQTASRLLDIAPWLRARSGSGTTVRAAIAVKCSPATATTNRLAA